jgi:hypothetical protein
MHVELCFRFGIEGSVSIETAVSQLSATVGSPCHVVFNPESHEVSITAGSEVGARW